MTSRPFQAAEPATRDRKRSKIEVPYSRLVDVCEELVKFTWLVRGRSAYLTDRYSERVESVAELSKRVNQRAI